MQYDYSKPRQHCESVGLVWDSRMIEIADAEFEKAHLTQAQVDAVMITHIEVVRWLFSPKSYGFWQRIALAIHFLFNPKRL